MSSERRYEPALDALRACAVLAVAWCHWAPNHQYGIPFGFGVDLFFVLSGYLITSILLDIRHARDRGHGLAIFYARRALRIFPAYYMTMAVAAIFGVTIVRDTWKWDVTYLSNVLTFLQSRWPDAISHWWSLAVEEQFYLLWPCIIVFAPRRLLLPLLAVAIASAPIFRGWLAARGHPVEFTNLLIPGSLDCLGAGSLLAFAGSAPRPVTIARARLWIFASLILGATATIVVWRDVIALEVTAQTFATALFVEMISRAAAGLKGSAATVLLAEPVVYLGRISYGFYLIHNFAPSILRTACVPFGISVLEIPPAVRLLLMFGISTGLASLSWHFMEEPINDLKRQLPYRQATSRAPFRSAALPSALG